MKLTVYCCNVLQNIRLHYKQHISRYISHRFCEGRSPVIQYFSELVPQFWVF
jgi:hypothetical protein